MSEQENRPLLTLAIIAYNQERFVREAIEGAFAQTYTPLEIILSDDASSDRTFAIMQEMAAAYRGPHTLVLNRSPENAGLAAHINRVFEIAGGELVVGNAGDDISLPHRVAAIRQAWEAGGRKPLGVQSLFIRMDQWGKFEGEKPTQLRADAFQFENGLAAAKQYMREGTPGIRGCTAAWHRQLFERFGPLPRDVIYEDVVLSFRSRLLGGMAFIDDPLVLYRLHDTNTYYWNARAPVTVGFLRIEERRRRVDIERTLVAARSLRADLQAARAQQLVAADELRAMAMAVEGYARSYELVLDFHCASWLGRLMRYPRLRRSCSLQIPLTRNLWRYLLPRWAYYAIRIAKSRLCELRLRQGSKSCADPLASQ